MKTNTSKSAAGDAIAMSLSIDVEQVAAVLLPDAWHTVENASFQLGTYEYVRRSGQTMRWNVHDDALVPEHGAKWDERDQTGGLRTVFCPLTSIRAVAYAKRSAHEAASRDTEDP